jgi:uncharacterized protein (DUF362 family)
VNRRGFLVVGGRTIGAGLLGFASRSVLAQEAHETVAKGPDLVVARGEPAEAVRQALDAFGGLHRVVKPGDVVVIKPNASFASPPQWGATTHPDVLTAVMRACADAGARRTLVVDHTLAPAETCFPRNGTTGAVAAISGAKLVSLDKEKMYREVDIPLGEALHKTAIAQVVLKADVFINLPTAKAHSATEVSFGLKNLMGVIWDRQTFHNDMDVHVGIADLATAVRPHLTILDAMRILKTQGPAGPGDVKSFGGVVVGCDPVAVDAYAVGLSTWNRQTLNADQVGFIRHAAARGVGNMDLKSLKILELA